EHLAAHRGLTPWPTCGTRTGHNTTAHHAVPAPRPATQQPAAEPDTAADADTGPIPADSATVVVQDGNTLDGITRTLQLPGGWPALYAANQDVIGDNPDVILPGQTLRLP
ncbi:hypothetical protein ABZ641_36810, partial [Kitasatospora sp. NPDC007106]